MCAIEAPNAVVNPREPNLATVAVERERGASDAALPSAANMARVGAGDFSASPLEEWCHRLVRDAVAWRQGLVPELYQRRLAAFEKLSGEEKHRRSFAMLKHVVLRAYQSVPYYRGSFDGLGLNPHDLRVPEDFAHFPLLAKRDLIDHCKELVGSRREAVGAEWNASGGSTGEPVRFLNSLRALSVVHANVWRTWRWYGIRRGARQAFIWGSNRDVPPDQDARNWRNRLSGVCRLNAFYIDDERCRAFTRILTKFQPEIIYGYATALARFANFLRDTGTELPIRPWAIRSTAEVLLPESRGLIEEQLGGPVYDFYGSRDAGPIASESPAREGLHVFSDVAWVEVIRPDGTTCEPGEVGEVVVTKLNEFAFPMIRYRTGDSAALLAGEGWLGFPRLSALEGRIGDFIRTPAGHAIHGEFFTHLFYGVQGVARFQVRQTSPTDLRILVEPAGQPQAEELERIRRAAAEHFGARDPSAVTLEIVKAIAPSPSGKHRFVLPYED
jgi:phenylacetate-CoA ligase